MTSPYSFEFDEPVERNCSCCGSAVISLTRFVYRHGDAFAVYKASLAFGSHERAADIVMNVGDDWGDDDANRTHPEFAIMLSTDENSWNFSLVDSENSIWCPGLLGSILPRTAQLESRYIDEVFAICDQMVIQDEALIRYFNNHHRGNSALPRTAERRSC